MAGGSAGVSRGPVPWWQLPTSNINELASAAPPGYEFDRVTNQFRPIIGGPTDALSQRDRTQGIQDTNLKQQQSLFERLTGMLDGMGGSSSSSGGRQQTPGNGTLPTGPGNSSSVSQWIPGGGGSGGSSQPIKPFAGSSVAPVSVGAAPDIPVFNEPKTGNISQQAKVAAASLAPASSYGTPATVQAASAPARSSAPAWQSITGPSQAVQDAEESATFGKVKDNAANTAQAAMRGLTDSLAARGMSGGGYEGGQIGQTLSREANQIGEGERQWASTRYADSQHRADVNTQAGLTARGQDLGSSTAERGQDIGLSVADLGSRTAQRGQDIGASTAARGQDLGLAEANLGSATTQRGQDIGVDESNQSNATANRGQDMQAMIARISALLTGRGQDIDVMQGNQQTALTSRGQDLGGYEAGLSADTARRGQDVNSADARRGQDVSARGQDVTMRGQDQENTRANAALAQQKDLALQEMLMKMLTGMGRSTNAY